MPKKTIPRRQRLRVPSQRRNWSAAELSVSVGLPSARIARTIFEALEPETRTVSHFRSKATVARQGRSLELMIVSSDVAALRAASNSFLKFVAVALKTVEVVAPFYSKGSPARNSKRISRFE